VKEFLRVLLLKCEVKMVKGVISIFFFNLKWIFKSECMWRIEVY
jgi:hypothetical protein